MTLTVAELKELLHGTAQVLVAGMKEAVVEAVQGVLSIQTSQFRKEPPERRPKEKPASPNLLMKANEVAEFLGVDVRTAWRFALCGVLPPPIKVGGTSRWHRRDIESWIDQKAAEAEQERQRLARRWEGAG